jgi:hypothetical protein
MENDQQKNIRLLTIIKETSDKTTEIYCPIPTEIESKIQIKIIIKSTSFPVQNDS